MFNRPITTMKLTVTQKLLLSVLAFGLVVYIGGTIVRTAVAFEIYVPGTEMTLKTEYSDALRLHTVKLFATGALYTDIGFIAALIASIGICIVFNKQVKQKGWLFIALMLIFIATPIELYLTYLDFKLNSVIWDAVGSFNDVAIKEFFARRFTKLTIPSALAFLAISTSILLAVWRPLDKSVPKSETTEVNE